MVPLLPWLFGLNFHEAVATSLTTVFFISSLNTYKYAQRGLIVWDVGLLLGGAAVVGSALGASIGYRLPTFWLKSALVITFCGLAVQIAWSLFKDQNKSDPATQIPTQSPTQSESSQNLDRPRRSSLITMGASNGFLSGLTGIGGGIVLTALLLNARALPARNVVPTTNLYMVMVGFASVISLMMSHPQLTWTHLGPGRLDLAMAHFTGAFFVSGFGRKYQHLLSEQNHRWIVLVLIVALLIKVVLQA